MVTEFPPDAARFKLSEYEVTGASKVNREKAVPAKLAMVSRTFPVPVPLIVLDAHWIVDADVHDVVSHSAVATINVAVYCALPKFRPLIVTDRPLEGA
jgi:hypothetical protein